EPIPATSLGGVCQLLHRDASGWGSLAPLT
ncbi:hypothetical protein AVDCRST_MAG94-185, partial [uncultured Leptolyngbya sp.]